MSSGILDYSSPETPRKRSPFAWVSLAMLISMPAVYFFAPGLFILWGPAGFLVGLWAAITCRGTSIVWRVFTIFSLVSLALCCYNCICLYEHFKTIIGLEFSRHYEYWRLALVLCLGETLWGFRPLVTIGATAAPPAVWLAAWVARRAGRLAYAAWLAGALIVVAAVAWEIQPRPPRPYVHRPTPHHAHTTEPVSPPDLADVQRLQRLSYGQSIRAEVGRTRPKPEPMSSF